MVAFNFKQDFADDVEQFIKIRSIRAKKKCNVGDKIQLYTGQRTKSCRKLGDAICVGVARIRITDDCPWSIFNVEGDLRMNEGRLHELDGFKNAQAFVEFFRGHYGLPFNGWMHVWERDESLNEN